MPSESSPSALLRFFVELFSKKRVRAATFVSVLLVSIPFYTAAIRPPADFPAGEIIEVPKGATLREITEAFEARGVVRSAFWLQAFVIAFSGERSVYAGDYLFPEPSGVVRVAWSLARGRYGVEHVRVTIPEGASVREIPGFFDARFTKFSKDEFFRLAGGSEGYLFPDTYFFLPDVRARDVVRTMADNFDEKIRGVRPAIDAFGKPLADVITMASLLEKEARTEESRRIIAGILWKRLSIGMALQVDAVFPFIMGKNTYELTTADLAIDSPYNTYRYRGLPPGPITNPGLAAIRDAVTPIESNYLYYLTGRDGTMHYAAAFDEHVHNKVLYLR